jgi:hypothetical protein
MSVTSIVTALFIAAFFCLIVALLLTRAERKHRNTLHPFRPAEPDTGDDDYPAACAAQPERSVGVRSESSMTAPTMIETEWPYRSSMRETQPVTNLVTIQQDLAALHLRCDGIEESMRVERCIRMNHRHELDELRDLVDLLNCEAQPERSVGVRSDEDEGPAEQPAAPAELEITQPLPVIGVHKIVGNWWSQAMPNFYPERVRIEACCRIAEAGGRLDFLL